MLLAYGHAGIEWCDVKYRIAPTFANIAKIGSPSDIVADFHQFITEANQLWKFTIALNIVNACCDPELPIELTGSTEFVGGKLIYHKPDHDLPMINDVITFAEHCFIHGICGKTKEQAKPSGKPIVEFDAYEFMEQSRVHLGLSASESANMTMTEFVRMMSAKFPPEKNENDVSEAEQTELLKWFEENNK